MVEPQLVDSAAILKRIDAWWDEWLAAIDGMSDDELSQPGVCDEWSAKALMSHVAVWEEIATPHIERGVKAADDDEDGEWNLDRFNAEMATRDASMTLEQARSRMLDVHDRLRRTVASKASVDPELVASDTYDHYPDHVDQLLDWQCSYAGERGAGLTQDQIAGLVSANWRAWVAAIDQVPDERRDDPGVCGEWSANDLVSHVAMCDRLALEAIEHKISGVPLPPQDDWQTQNTLDAAANSGRPYPERRADMDETHARLVDLLRDATGIDAQLIGSDTYAHYPQHTAQVRAWKRWSIIA